jgi:hypothetical protein
MSAVTMNRAWVAKAAKQPLTLETIDLGPLGVETLRSRLSMTNEWGVSRYPRSSGTRSSVALQLLGLIVTMVRDVPHELPTGISKTKLMSFPVIRANALYLCAINVSRGY